MVMQNTAGNPLAAASISIFMATSLPKDASPPLKNPYDVIALAAHACMIAVGFRLIGLGEDHKIESHADAHDPQPLPSEWNATSSYAFRYAHAQSSMEYLVKINRLGSKVVILGLAVGDDKTAQCEAKVDEYISKEHLDAAKISSETSIEDARGILQDVFLTSGRLNDFGALLKVKIIQKLAPSLHKEGYEETPREVDDPEPSNQRGRRDPPQRLPEEYPEPARPHPFNDPLAAPPQRGNRPLPEPIPGFEDEFEMNRPPRGLNPPGRSPFGYGEQDLYPPGLGPHDPLRPHFGGGGGLRSPGSGGMHPTLDDPLFGGVGGGVGGYDPRAPPGARYDPVGPGDAPRDRMSGPRFPGGGGLGGRPPNPFSGFGDGDFI